MTQLSHNTVLDQQTLSLTGPTALRKLYDQYADMLYGYILEVVKDQQLAERYLLLVFNDLQEHFTEVLLPGVNVYYKLQQFTRKKLDAFWASCAELSDGTGSGGSSLKQQNRFLDNMSEEQRKVFCNIHYHGKSISAVAAEMNRNEDEIRKFLQQAFIIIRRAA